MERKKILLASIGAFFFNLSASTEATFNRFVIVIASYNNIDYYKGNIDSVLMQDYPREYMRVVYIDDCSPDGTGDAVEEYITENDAHDFITVIRNTERKRCLANQYAAIHASDDNEIVIILDGDDQLYDKTVVSFVNSIYRENPEIWMTYGQYYIEPGGTRGHCIPYPQWVVRYNAFRRHEHIPSHLRTFRVALFKKIKKEDLMDEDEFLPMTGDMAMNIPLIEMARNGHYRFVSRYLCRYNGANPLNDHKVSKELQRKYDLLVRSREPYDALESLDDQRIEKEVVEFAE